ncbi:SusC/RagA family TonB-linked outer membrane protein [Chitinophaga sp. 22620]|uniref:SusC/RagA family TonB-linked outer membrane protein n=1 Tax=Chitinophaga sp. 22620 TaxID=3453952 RepID=UPI003F827E76
MRKGLTVLFLLLVCLSGQVLAQSRTIKGKVTAADDGTPIIGATVLAKGTNVGTVTNSTGDYTLNVPDGATTLVIRFIGMRDQEARISGETVNIVLSADVTNLTETVVTAQAIRRDKRSLGYAAPTVKAEEITRGQSVSPLNALTGKVAGVNITGTASAPGSSSRIVLRGGSSIAGNNQALLVVDGVPIDNESIIGGGDSRSAIDFGNRGNDINPDDIENISILKGPAAAALYGSRASNGALIITTKSGKKGGNSKQEITYTSALTLSNILKLPTFQNEFGQGFHFEPDLLENFSWGAKFDGTQKEWGQEINGQRLSKPWSAQPDNVKKFFEMGKAWNNNVSLSGGNEKSTYYLSLNSLNSDGVMPGNYDKYNKYGVRFNGSTELSNKFSTSIGVNYTKINSNMIQGGQGDGSVYDNVLQTPRDIPLQDMGDLKNPYYSYGDVLQDADGNPQYGYYGAYTNQPYWVLREFKNLNDVDRVTGNFTVTYKPLSWLTFTERLGADVYSDRRRIKQAKADLLPVDGDWSEKNLPGAYEETKINLSDIVHDLMVTARHDFSKDFNATLMVGNNIRQRTFTTLDAETNSDGLVIPGWYNLDNSNGAPVAENFYSQRRLVGLYGELNLAYKNMLFLGATARNDWSSTLPSANRSFFYPSVNGAFVFTELLKDSKIGEFLSYGKIRASYASVGNDADPYQLLNYYVRTQILGGFANTLFPFNGTPGLTMSNIIGNPNLKPERTNAFEIGTELNMWDNRLSVDFSYYQNKSKDQILAAPIAPSTGFASEIMNTGVVENKGVELGLRVTPIRTSTGFTWELFGTYTKNDNTVVSLLPGVDQVVVGGISGMSIVAAVGRPYGTFYARDYLRDDQGRMVINDESGLPELTPDARYFGSYNPKWMASWGTNLSYKGISLSVLFDTKQGGYFYSRTSDIMTFVGTTPRTVVNDRQPYVVPNTVVRDRANPGKYIPNTAVETQWMDFWTNQQIVPDAAHIIDGSYIKLREVSLSYRLPKTLLNRTPFGDASFGLFGNNLWISTPKENMFADPEVNSGGAGNEQGFDFTAQPSLRNFGVNLKVSF